MGMILRLGWRLIKAGVVTLAITMAAVYAAERIALTHYAPERLGPVDAIIVLGGGVAPDQQLNFVGRRRADIAAGLLRTTRANFAIFSGTLIGAPDRPEGEAGLMRNHVNLQGIDATRLFVEPDSTTTLENLRFSFDLADAQGHETLAIVTDAFHLPRALALAALLGRDVSGVATDGVDEHTSFARIGYLMREAMAWWYNLGKAAAWEGMALAGMSEAERGALVR